MSGDEGPELKLRRTRSSTFSPVWDYFTKGNKNGQFYEATCNFCSHKFTWGKAGEMISHLKNKCPLATLEVKTDPTLVQSPPKPRKGSNASQRLLTLVAESSHASGSHPAGSRGSSSRRSRPRKPVWDFFHIGKAYHNSHAAKCRYCGHEYAAGIPEQLTSHLVKLCPGCPVEIKEAFTADPTGETARTLNSDFVLSNEVEWDYSGDGQQEDAVSKLLAVDDQPEPAAGDLQTPKRTQKTLAEGRKPGTGQAGMGRSRNTVWEHFNKGVKRGYFYEIFCKYCNYTNQTGVPVKMIEHLKFKCPLVPEDVKNEEFFRPDRVSGTAPAALANGHGSQTRHHMPVFHNGSMNQSLRSHDRVRVAYPPTSPDSELGDLSAVTRAVGLASIPSSLSGKRPNSDGTIALRSKRKRTIPVQISSSVPNHPARPTCGVGVDKEKFHQALSRCFTMCGVTLALLEHPAFRQLLLCVNPTVDIPSPQYFSEVITECEIIRVDSLTNSVVDASVYITMGIKLIGGATCLLLVSLLTCVDEHGQKKSFVWSVDKVPQFSNGPDAVTDPMDSALRWITDRINVQVDQVGAKKVVAVVDSHADGRLASSSLPRHISALPSVLPVFENLLSALVKHKHVAGLAESGHFISSFVTANVSVQDKFTEYGVQVVLKKVQLGLSTPLTVLENMQSLLQHQDVIRKAMTTLYGEVDETDTDNVGNVPYAMRFVGSNGFWRELEDVATLAEPLVMALGLSRSETITLGDAFYFLLAHGKRLSSGSRKGISSLPAKLNRACVVSLNAEFAKLDCPILRLSYLLHPLYRGDGLFDLLPDDVLLEAGEWSKSMSRTADQTVATIKQLRRFKARLPPFSEPFHAADSPMSFWQRLTSSAGIELRQLAVRLLAISPVTVIAGPEWNAAALASSLRVMPPEAVAKAIQLQHFYHVNAADEFHDVQTVFGSASNQEKLLDIVKTDEDMGHLKDAGMMKDERPDSDMSDEEDDVVLSLDVLVDFSNPIFESMPKSWTAPKTTLKVEESATSTSSEEYDVRQLLLGMDGE